MNENFLLKFTPNHTIMKYLFSPNTYLMIERRVIMNVSVGCVINSDELAKYKKNIKNDILPTLSQQFQLSSKTESIDCVNLYSRIIMHHGGVPFLSPHLLNRTWMMG